MTRQLVTEAGFYGGQFLKPGQHCDDGEAGESVSEKLPKEELLSIAATRGLEIDASKTKAEIVATINVAG